MKRDDHPEFPGFGDEEPDPEGPDYLSQKGGPDTSKQAGRIHQSDNRGVFPLDSYKGNVLEVYADGSELNRYEARDKAHKRFGKVAETFRKRVSDLFDIGYLENVKEVDRKNKVRPYQSKSDCEVLRISERGLKYYRQIKGQP